MISYVLTQREEMYDVADNCDHIEEHLPQGDGDRVYYTISLGDGKTKRIFDPVEVGILEER